ncbi:hypothetical protein [uncultured Sulfitobacter sp.]|uniref:hypothetical protein n=1 Tax=uncultured Sulfitobacter sp. TaxID=191468 RepID=UPI00260C8E7C|nr:hypothetical protein [uncultured Sulfitobacter sp.]
MFYIRCGGLIAWILVVIGLLRACLGVFIAFSATAPDVAVTLARALGAVTLAEAILGGLALFGAGIVMGLLVQIAKGVKFE